MSNFTWTPPDVNPDAFQEIRTQHLNLTIAGFSTRAVHYVTLVSGTIATMAGTVLLLLLFRRVIGLDRDFRVMFANLTLADLMTAVGLLSSAIQNLIIYPEPIEDELCITQSFVSTMSVMASFLWTIVIGIVCFRDACHYDQSAPLRIRTMPLVVLHILCWGIPLVIMVAAWQFGVLGENVGFGNTAGWCWIRSCDDHCTTNERVKLFLWMLFTGKLWEFLSYLSIVNIIILGYFLHFRKSNSVAANFAETIPHGKVEVASHTGFLDNISQTSNECHHTIYSSLSFKSNATGDEGPEDNVAKLLFWIPVALIFSRVWGTVRFVLDGVLMFQPGLHRDDLTSIDDVFMYFQAVGDCSQTTCNFILTLIFSRNVRDFLLCRPWRLKNYEEI